MTYGTINNLTVKDMDFSEDYAVRVYTEPPMYKRDSVEPYGESEVVHYISYETVVQMYESLFENHPGYPEKLYGEVK
tara:strand:- start:4657 stop:4887 length:231 start_codon:yes stop_codon:yes gene_type:complete